MSLLGYPRYIGSQELIHRGPPSHLSVPTINNKWLMPINFSLGISEKVTPNPIQIWIWNLTLCIASPLCLFSTSLLWHLSVYCSWVLYLTYSLLFTTLYAERVGGGSLPPTKERRGRHFVGAKVKGYHAFRDTITMPDSRRGPHMVIGTMETCHPHADWSLLSMDA